MDEEGVAFETQAWCKSCVNKTTCKKETPDFNDQGDIGCHEGYDFMNCNKADRVIAKCRGSDK